MPNIVKNTTFFNLLDLLAPHSCRGCGRLGSVLCDCCKNNILANHKLICPKCKTINEGASCPNCPELPPIYVIGERTDTIGKLAQDLKYNSVRAAAPAIADIVNHIIPTPNQQTTLVPLPTISRHVRSRGLDHTLLIAKHLARLHQEYKVEPILIRAQNTIQVGADSKTRHLQASKAYTINPTLSIDPTIHYILIDDVWTTGSSMTAAIEKLRQAGAQHISGIILALSRFHQK